MLTTFLATATAITLAATISHVNSEASDRPVSVSELWKIRAYQEDDARSLETANKESPSQRTSEQRTGIRPKTHTVGLSCLRSRCQVADSVRGGAKPNLRSLSNLQNNPTKKLPVSE